MFGGTWSVMELRRVRARAAEQEEQLRHQRAVIDSLEAWADSLRTDPNVLERIAREKYGLIRDGEVLYRFPETRPPTPDSGGGR